MWDGNHWWTGCNIIIIINNAWVSLTLGAGVVSSMEKVVLVRHCVFIQGHQWQMRRDLLQ